MIFETCMKSYTLSINSSSPYIFICRSIKPTSLKKKQMSNSSWEPKHDKVIGFTSPALATKAQICKIGNSWTTNDQRAQEKAMCLLYLMHLTYVILFTQIWKKSFWSRCCQAAEPATLAGASCKKLRCSICLLGSIFKIEPNRLDTKCKHKMLSESITYHHDSMSRCFVTKQILKLMHP